MKTRITLFLLAIISYSAIAQNTFEGIIKYGTQNSSNEAPTTITATHKNEKLKIETETKEMNISIISNNSDIATLILELKQDFIIKVAMEISINELKGKLNFQSNFTSKKTTEEKKIAGQICYKVVGTNTNIGTYAYVADKIYTDGYDWLFDGQIKNVIMELQTKGPNDSVKSLQLKSIMNSKIDDKEFEIPSDCMLISIDDIKSILGEDFVF